MLEIGAGFREGEGGKEGDRARTEDGEGRVVRERGGVRKREKRGWGRRERGLEIGIQKRVLGEGDGEGERERSGWGGEGGGT